MNALTTPLRFEEDLEAALRQLEVDSMERTLRTPYFQEVARRAFAAFRELNEALATGGFDGIDRLSEITGWTGVKG